MREVDCADIQNIEDTLQQIIVKTNLVLRMLNYLAISNHLSIS